MVYNTTNCRIDPTQETQLEFEQDISNAVEEGKLIHQISFVEQIESYSNQIQQFKMERKVNKQNNLSLPAEKVRVEMTICVVVRALFCSARDNRWKTLKLCAKLVSCQY